MHSSSILSCLILFAVTGCGPMEPSVDANGVDGGVFPGAPVDAGVMARPSTDGGEGADGGSSESLAGRWRLVGTWRLENQQKLRTTHTAMATESGSSVRFEVEGFCTLRATRQGATLTLDPNQQCTVPTGQTFPIQAEMLGNTFTPPMSFTASYCYGVALDTAQPATLTPNGFSTTGLGAADSQCQTRPTRPCALEFEFARLP